MGGDDEMAFSEWVLEEDGKRVKNFLPFYHLISR